MGKKLIKYFKTFKLYPLIPFISLLGIQNLMYFGSQILNSNFHYNVVKWPIDNKIPFIPSMSLIYFGCYIFWFTSPMLMGKYLTKERFYRYITALLLSHIICFIIFLIYPTKYVDPRMTIDEVDSFTKWVCMKIYLRDTPTNLLPSVHTTVSWLCFIPFRFVKDGKVLKKLVWFQGLFAILVLFSTLAVKQHYLIDIIFGVLLVEILFFISNKTNLYKVFMKFFTKINKFFKLEK